MEIEKNYTILNNSEVKFEEKKSIFICNISRVKNENDALEFIDNIKSKYKDATHNVYAYITNNGISMRYSDDGEPQGTAGPPVLEVLKREGLNDVACVVTRYFGGTLLGAGGLIRAYSRACKMGVDESKKVLRETGIEFTLKCDYERYGKINNYLQNKNVIIKGTEFMENVRMTAICLMEDFDNISSDIIEFMNGDNTININSKELYFVDEWGRLIKSSNC